MGRKKLTADEKKQRIVLYLPPDLAAALEAIPRRERGRWVADLLRAALLRP